MTDDVVAELDAWLDRNPMTDRVLTLAALVQRARDEIVALRGYLAECERQFQAKVAEIGTLLDRVHQARAEALEQAARVCEGGYTTGSTGSTQEHLRNSIEDLGRLIAAKRVGRGVRAAALEVGVSPATLSRVENGHMPDLETFAKICQWLDRDPREFLGMEVRDEAKELCRRDPHAEG